MTIKVVDEAEARQAHGTTVEILTEIWQGVLQRSPIHPNETFFDLGGTDAQADETFLKIAKAFGRHLPTATICHAQTIDALATLLEQPVLPPFPPFVHLRAGSKHPPIIIGHGVGGRASFPQLAKYILSDHAVYGIQARAVDGRGEPIGSIEDMAEYYLRALDDFQPQGPYMLVGYSFGGLIALEMAQRLNAAGKRIALLALIDTYPHRRFLQWDQRLFHDAKRIRTFASEIREMQLENAFSRVGGALKRRLGFAVPRGATYRASTAPRLTFAETTAYVKRSDFAALKLYRPRFYPGKIKFIKPAKESFLPNDPAMVWKDLAAEFDVETVPGDHLGMVGRRFKELAEVLTRYVQEASVEQR